MLGCLGASTPTRSSKLMIKGRCGPRRSQTGQKPLSRCSIYSKVTAKIERMNPESLYVTVLVLCPASIPASASLTVPIARTPVQVPYENPERGDHPPHGEGSGELVIFSGIGASGAMTNTTNAVPTTPTWEPSTGHDSEFNRFFLRPAPPVMLQVNSVTPRRPFLPRARRSCKS
jgi:hypothetical protein